MVQLSNIELPIILKKRLLFSKGYWNNWDITEQEVKKAFENSHWERKKVQSLYYQHKDQDAEKWTGNVLNPYYEKGNVYGDLEIWDPEAALKVVYGKAPYAVSAKIVWESKYKDPTNFKFENFSFVADPGVDKEEIYINFSKEGTTENEANLIINQKSDSPSIERRLSSSQEKMESDDVKKEVLEEQKAEFSQEDFKKLSERVSLLEEKFSKITENEEESNEAEEKVEEPAKEESKEESKDESEEQSDKESKEESGDKSEEKVEEPAKEESKEESKDESEEQSDEESKEESKEESEDETEAKFSNEILEELKGIREAIGKSVVPASSANFTEESKTGFEAAFDRIEKEFA